MTMTWINKDLLVMLYHVEDGRYLAHCSYSLSARD